MSRLPAWTLLGLMLTVSSAAYAQSDDPASALEALRAADDPALALEGLGALLGREDLPQPVRLDAEQERPRLLLRLGRRAEAEAAWRELLRVGHPVGGELLRLAGSELSVSAGDGHPDRPATLSLRGQATGPLELRVYRVDVERWQATALSDPSLPLDFHLRAPPPSTLQRLAAWAHEGLPQSGGELALSLPEALPPGLYLVTASARGVVLPAPLRVTRARALVRRRAGAGSLFLLDDQRGRPLPTPQVWIGDEDGFGWSPLTTRGPGGVAYTWSSPDPRQAWVWEPAWGPLRVSLPGASAPRAPAREVVTDLPVYRPGQTVHARVLGTPRRPLRLTVLDPRGLQVDQTSVVTDRSGLAQASVSLPPRGALGDWRLELGDARAVVPVRAPPPEALELTLTGPPTSHAPSLELAAAAALRSGVPLAGRVMRWSLRAIDARPGSSPALSPLPLHALRPVAGAEWVALNAGALTLDALGAGAWSVSIPPGGPRLLLLEASFDVGSTRVRATRWIAHASGQVVLDLRPQAAVVSAGDVLGVDALAAGLDGRPVGGLSLVVEARDAAGAVVGTQALRTNEYGRATGFFTPRQAGAVELVVRGADAEARAGVFVVGPGEERSPRLILTHAQTDEAPAEVVARVPFTTGFVVFGWETDSVQSQLVEVEDGLARWELPAAGPPGGRVLLDAWRDGSLHQAALEVPLQPASLELEARIADYDAETVRVNVRTLTHDGQDRPAAVTGVIYPEETARWLERGAEAGIPQRVEATGGRPAAWTNGRGLGALRLELPQRPGRYWIRLDAVDAGGSQGQSWLPFEVGSRLAVDVHGPGHLVVGDHAELSLRLSCGELGGLLPDASLRLSWSASGVELGRPKLLGARPLLGTEPGPATLLLTPAETVWVSLPASARAPGPARVTVTLSLTGSTAESVATTFELPVVPRGLRVERRFAGSVEPGETVEVPLELPADAATRPLALELSVDPEPVTAALAGVEDVLRARPGLRGELQALRLRGPLAALLELRRLSPPRLPGAGPDRAQVLARLSATWDAAAGWGPATASIALSLQALRAGGQPIPGSLVERALTWLAERADLGARETLALVRGGRISALTPVDPAAHRPDELVTWLQAQVLVGPDVRTEALLAAVLEQVDALRSTQARAELYLLLLAFDREPALRERLLEQVLADRRGAGWDDPDDAGAALRALLARARLDVEQLGARFRAQVDGWDLCADWSGDGLREWRGAVQLADRLGRRSELTLTSVEAPAPLRFAGRVEAYASAPAPGGAGLRVETELTLDGRAVGVAGVSAGQLLRLRVELGALDDRGLAGTLLELPLPGGCLPASWPADARLEGGILSWEPRAERLELELLAVTVGDFRVLPPRLRDLRAPGRVAVGVERRLRIRRP